MPKPSKAGNWPAVDPEFFVRLAKKSRRWEKKLDKVDSHPLGAVKQITILTAMVLGAPLATLAQAPALSQTIPHCYLEVRNVSDFNEIRSHWETSWGSYDRDKFQRQVLHIRTGTTGRITGPIKVGWYFVGREAATHRQLIYGEGVKQLTLQAAYFVECYAAAPQLKSHDLNLALARRRHQSGTIQEGWIVYVVNDKDQIIGAKASTEALLQLFNRKEEFAGVLAAKKPR